MDNRVVEAHGLYRRIAETPFYGNRADFAEATRQLALAFIRVGATITAAQMIDRLPDLYGRDTIDRDDEAKILVARGRLAFLENEAHQAIEHHQDAEVHWRELAAAKLSYSEVDRYDNLVAWLQARLATTNLSDPLTYNLAWRIEHERPADTSSRLIEAVGLIQAGKLRLRWQVQNRLKH